MNSNKKNPRVSIVMPLYNSAAYLREAINSIIEQTFTDWEMIIINEAGSNDGSREIVEEYSETDDRIILVQNDKRLGISASMNVGFDMAKGDYIARMDGDDISLPERLAEQVEFMDNNPDIGMCGVKVEILSSNPFEWNLETSPEKINTDILFYSPSVHPTVMLRKSVVDKYNLRYNPDYKASEDYELFSKVCEVTKVCNIDKVLFRYRMMENNATFKNNGMGFVLYNDVMDKQLKKMGLEFTEKEIKLLSPHYCMKGAKYEEVIDRFIELDLLLKKILVANEKCKVYDRKYLSMTLHKRYKDAYDSMSWACKDFDQNLVDEFYDKSIFSNKCFYEGFKGNLDFEPLITVLMPTYNSEKYVADTIWSVLNQTFTQFEFLIVNEFGSNDDTVTIIKMFDDPRIKIIQNETRLGLADSLNLGIREAKGKYIARVDADDLYRKDRFQIQFDFMEKNPDYGVYGSWQHHFGKNTNHIHKVPTTNSELKAAFIYNCELCHSTLLLRKDMFIENNLFYDKNCAAEDYELWTRAIQKFKFGNTSQVLGEYRVGEDNITAKKLQMLSEESGEIAYRNINKYLNVNIPKEHINYLTNWINEFNNIKNDEDYKKALDTEKKILCDMFKNNEKLRVYDSLSLLKVINRRWRWSTNNWVYGTDLGEIYPIDKLFEIYGIKKDGYKEVKTIRKQRFLKRYLKSIAMFFYRPFKYKIVDRIQRQIWDLDGHLKDTKAEILENIHKSDDEIKKEFSEIRKFLIDVHKENEQILNTFKKIDKNFTALDDKFNNINDKINESEKEINTVFDARIWKAECNINQTTDGRIWKAESNINQITDARIWKAESNIMTVIERNNHILSKINKKYFDEVFEYNKIPFLNNEKIRMVFLFQAASFWPSWESFYNKCINDKRLEVKFILYDKVVEEKSQMLTARKFLVENNIDFIYYNDFNIESYKPHVLVMQTPYDEIHREIELWSENIKALGIRIVYIPYGMEIGDSSESKLIQYDTRVINNCWRIYTFSDAIMEYYKRYCLNFSAVRAFGLPKFDDIRNKEKFKLPESVIKKINGRKVCFWQIHFPKTFWAAGENLEYTPYIDVYLEFSKKIQNYKNIFFMFRPHPKYIEMCKYIEGAEEKCKKMFEIINNAENVYYFTEDDYRPALVNSDYIITDRSSLMVEAGVFGVPVLYMRNKDNEEPMTKPVYELLSSYYQGTGCEDMESFINMCIQGKDDKKEERIKAFNKCVPYTDNKCGERILNDIIQSLKAEN